MNMDASYDVSPACAQALDAADKIASYKERFFFPQHQGEPVIYFCGNSLGLLPHNTPAEINTELESWKELAIAGYTKGTNPWLYYQHYCHKTMADIVGAKEAEVTVMNSLTINLHLLLITFYRPQGKRCKIIMEAGAFPSDQYAVETQVRHHGLNPDECIVEIKPAEGEKLLSTQAICDVIAAHAGEVCVVLLSGMNYYSGQFFDMEAITEAAHSAGAYAGFDLAHVAGNVPVQLHAWNVDFAVWCTYKYLNAGPGSVGGAFVHQSHVSNTSLHRLAGWWGNEESTRFKMEKGFIPKRDASGWCVSTAQVFNTVALKASLEMFGEVGMEQIRKKSIALTGYLQFLLQQLTNLSFSIVTPLDAKWRGAQLSLYFEKRGREVHDAMHAAGIVVDYREPGVIRVAPAPLYCSFQDVYRFYTILKSF